MSPLSHLSHPGDSLLTWRKHTLTLAFAVNHPSNEFSLWSPHAAFVSWESNLTIPSLTNVGQKNEWTWRECLKPVLAIKWPSLRVNLFSKMDWPLQFISYTTDICHISALRGMHAIIISKQPHITGHKTVCLLLLWPYVLLNAWLGSTVASSTTKHFTRHHSSSGLHPDSSSISFLWHISVYL